MTQYEVVQRLASVATTYDVHEGGGAAIAFVARGAPTSMTPKFTLVDDKDRELATLEGNFNKTKFHIRTADNKELARVSFPSVAFKKTLALTVGDRTFNADAGVLALEYDFKCVGADGQVGVEVKKPEGLTRVRDRFFVTAGEDMPREVAVLLAVAIHSRYFEMI